jgi:DNA-directed RNA polymerase subunit K/omega
MSKEEIEEIEIESEVEDSDVESIGSDIESIAIKGGEFDEEDEEDKDEEEKDEEEYENIEENEIEDSDNESTSSDNLQNTIVGGDDFSDDEDEDDDYLQKMDKKMKQNIVDAYHHELKIHNSDEIDVACTVARNEDGYIVDPLHKTLPFVTAYEKARVLGERAKQIEAGAHPFVELEENVIDSYLIALREYEAKKIPFILQRPLPNGLSEYWKLSDLELLE